MGWRQWLLSSGLYTVGEGRRGEATAGVVGRSEGKRAGPVLSMSWAYRQGSEKGLQKAGRHQLIPQAQCPDGVRELLPGTEHLGSTPSTTHSWLCGLNKLFNLPLRPCSSLPSCLSAPSPLVSLSIKQSGC